MTTNFERLIGTRTQVGLRLLGTHGRRAHSLYPTLVSVLSERLGVRHAGLLARPVEVDGKTIDWYTSMDEEVREVDPVAWTAGRRS